MPDDADLFETQPNETQPFVQKNAAPVPRERHAPIRIPQRIGRFAVDNILGKGGFGIVYLATDEQLCRKIALKVPHPKLLKTPADADLYLTEARTVAGLEHPHIVPVYEVGSDQEFPIFVVSKYIEGHDLAQHVKLSPPTTSQVVQWITDLADALREAHRQGLVHRDVKPQNVLVDKNNFVYLVDFGLALRDEDYGKRLPSGGTPMYMSPEQAKGEGHRVDGRSDIFSLGVMFYELLAGRHPFRGNSFEELFEQIVEYDPKPIRQWRESVDREIERICFKMLAKRKSERYASAKDLTDDLEAFIESEKVSNENQISSPITITLPQTSSLHTETDFVLTNTTLNSSQGFASRTLRIVPKGLRSFDHQDADFFLELLPGTRDRNGIPETVAFWKNRVEERTPEKTFAVGLVYGPSGCGKSSMMKAGLIPRLSPSVLPIYMEATTDQTESTLANLLKKQLENESLPFNSSLNLKDLLGSIRRGQISLRNKKLLIVIDQFEQWLYANNTSNSKELLDALGQCDGSRVQAIVMVRDDFWMAATRFFRDLDIRLVEGHNSAAVDLFDIDHAQRVLKAFGRTFGKLGLNDENEKKECKQFIVQSVEGLAEENKVISVRLALFAEMMKDRPWTLKSLKEVGGTEGVGATFLEETFSAPGAPPEHRFHQVAAREVLRALLPSGGTEIKGHKKSTNELLIASGYAARSKDFNDLMHILDSELRLITPVDHSSNDTETESHESGSSTQFFQLTHDYLVPSLRDWLNRKQQETWAGRAEIKLSERTASWNIKRETKQLPSFFEWFIITVFANRRHWTVSQRKMMRRATRLHAFWSLSFLGMLSLLIASVFILRNSFETNRINAEAQASVIGLLQADNSKLPLAIEKLKLYHNYAVSPLESTYLKSPEVSHDRLVSALAIVNLDADLKDTSREKLVAFLWNHLLVCPFDQFLPISELLARHKNDFILPLWKIAKDLEKPTKLRFQAAAALAIYDPSNKDQWNDSELLTLVSKQMVNLDPLQLSTWKQAYKPISNRLLKPLQTYYVDPNIGNIEKSLTASLIAEIGSEDISTLVSMLVKSEPQNFSTLFKPLTNLKKEGVDAAVTELDKVLQLSCSIDWKDSQLNPLWKPIDKQTQSIFEQSNGIISERFAFTQNMPLTTFLELSERLRSSGYRPTRVRPYLSNDTSPTSSLHLAPENIRFQTHRLPHKQLRPFYVHSASPFTSTLVDTSQQSSRPISIAAVWKRDDVDWLLEANVPKSELISYETNASKNGLLIEDLCVIPTTNPNEVVQFITLWSAPTSKSSDSTTSDPERRWILADVDEATYFKSIRESESSDERIGFARTTTVRIDANGLRRYSCTWSTYGDSTESFSQDSGFDIGYRPQIDISSAPDINLVKESPSNTEVVKAYTEQNKQSKENSVNPAEQLGIALYATGDLENSLGEFDRLEARGQLTEDCSIYRLNAMARLGMEKEASALLELFVQSSASSTRKMHARIQLDCWLNNWKKVDEELQTAQEGAFQNGGSLEEMRMLARTLAVASQAAAGKSPERSDNFAYRSINVLEKLYLIGYREDRQLREEPSFNSLHSNPRFEQFLSKIERPHSFAIIRSSTKDFETKTVSSAELIDLTSVKKLLEKGFRPVGITVSSDGKPVSVTSVKNNAILLQRPLIPDSCKELLAIEQARAAIALIKLSMPDRVWKLLQQQPDPRVRNILLSYLTEYQIEPDKVIDQLRRESDLGVLRALIIAIGDFAQSNLLDAGQVSRCIAYLQEQYSGNSDSGIHSCCEWSLKQLAEKDHIKQVQDQLATSEPQENHSWYITKEGRHTMIILRPKESFLMGSPISEKDRYEGAQSNEEALHKRSIRRSFAIAAKEVTVEQFKKFRTNHKVKKAFSKEDDTPVNSINWIDAMAYCNWLNEQEGIPRNQWCYEANGEDHSDDSSANLMLNHDFLNRTGYRLPTEAEWEYATRSGSTTSRFYGESPGLLNRFAKSMSTNGESSTQSVGTFRPNDFGQFDSYGNVLEWCIDSFSPYHYRDISTDDSEMNLMVNDSERILRGGKFDDQASFLRSANRFYYNPTTRDASFGFRIARTYP